MTGFEVFRGRGNNAHRPDPTPMVRLGQRGVIHLNAAAQKALGRPRRVVLLHDLPDHIGVRPATAPTAASYAVSRQGSVTATAFLRFIGHGLTDSRRYTAEMHLGDLVVRLTPE